MKLTRAIWISLLTGLLWLGGPSGPAELGPRPAAASVSVALSVQELVDGSSRAVEAVALERHSTWERIGDGRRIVTYTVLRVDRALFGTGSDTVRVRTLGGVVGRIGQHVSGEPQLAMGEPCLLFLQRLTAETHLVTGRAQGHYPIVTDDDGARRLRASPDRGRVLPRKGQSISAHAELVGRPVPQAFETVRKARRKRDGTR
ncbi:MAG: hypothetical protein JRI23_23680 [Deltaproteobacteria bacterium]|nr:hypothetical protein [Deltaproteobacteria bacterium]MBW2534994.1 hypothetical protein [Deltaproteobacteria bacterium]